MITVRLAAKNSEYYKERSKALEQSFPDYIKELRQWGINLKSIGNRKVLLAYFENRVVGVWQFELRDKSIRNDKCIDSLGTYVRYGYKRRGIASALWNYGLKKYKPEIVNVFCYSRGGSRLLRKIISKHSELSWSAFDDHAGKYM